MKFPFFPLFLGTIFTITGAEQIIFNKPEQLTLDQKYKQPVDVDISAVNDPELQRDVLKISYRMHPGVRKPITITLTPTQLNSQKWDSISRIQFFVRGGLGTISAAIIDGQKENFVNSNFIHLGTQNWTKVTAIFNQTAQCHHWGGNNDGKMDRPLQVSSIRILIRPANLAAQLRNTNFLFSLKPTEQEIAKGMKQEDLYLHGMEIDGVRQGEAVRQTQKTELDIVPIFSEIGTQVPLLEGHTKQLSVSAHNASATKRHLKWKAVCTLALTPKIETAEGSLELSPDKRGEFVLPYRFAEPGVHNVSITLQEGDRVRTAQTFVNVWNPVGNRWQDSPNNFFGTQCSLDLFDNVYGPYREQDYRNMSSAGVKQLRFTLRWSMVQPKENGPLNWKTYDKIIAKCLEHGIEPYPVIVKAPNWAIHPETIKSKPCAWYGAAPDNNKFAEFAAKAAARYRGKCRFFQIWNEPYAHQYYWGGSPATYADMLQKTYPAIKKANPNAVVCAGACWNEVFSTARGSFDIWPFHCHSGPEVLHQRINEHRKLLHGEKPDMSIFWVDETGFSVDPAEKDSELKKAAVVVQKVVVARAGGFSNHTWFIYRSAPQAPTNPRDNYPAIDEKHRCRPVVLAHNNVVRHLKQSKTVQSFRFPGMGEAHLFRQPEATVLVFWRTQLQLGQILHVKLGAPAVGQFYNLTGTPTPFKSITPAISHCLDSEPGFLVLPKDTEVKSVTIKSLLSAPSQVVIAPGAKKASVDFSISNTLPEPLNGSFSLVAADGWEPAASKIPIQIPSGKTEQFQFIYLKKNIDKKHRVNLPFSFCSPRNNLTFSGEFKLVSCIAIQQKWTLLGNLQKKNNTIDLRTGDVDPEMFWQGPQDLSARIWGKWNPSALSLKVEVTDNIHYQPRGDIAMFYGDSVQFAVDNTSNTNYHQFGLALDNDKKSHLYSWNGIFSIPPRYKITRNGTQTTYEIALPWKAIEIQPSKGMTLQLSILVNDNDGRCRKVLLEWGQGIHSRMGARQLNPMILE